LRNFPVDLERHLAAPGRELPQFLQAELAVRRFALAAELQPGLHQAAGTG
jgi:hypothetical protein